MTVGGETNRRDFMGRQGDGYGREIPQMGLNAGFCEQVSAANETQFDTSTLIDRDLLIMSDSTGFR